MFLLCPVNLTILRGLFITLNYKNFGFGQNLIVFDRSQLDIEDVKRKLTDWYKLRDTFYLTSSELKYKNIPPKLICEKLIKIESGDLAVDYKLYCYCGAPDCVLVCDKHGQKEHGAEYYFFDKNWNMKRYNKRGQEASEGFALPKPDKVFDYPARLSKPFSFVRSDFYLKKGKVSFRKLTFTPYGGFDVNRLPETQHSWKANHYLHLFQDI